MIRAAILGVSLWGPGLPGWADSRAILAGDRAWTAGAAPPPAPCGLPPAERRRVGPAARLALAVAQQASAMAGIAPGAIASVFATSNGEPAVVGALLETLASPDPHVSPTLFHNSVHNAAAGYWSIGSRSHAPFTCLGCHDASFAAGLLTAAAEVATEGDPVLLCAYDVPVPAPLGRLRATSASFGVGLVLAAAGTEGGPGVLALRHVAAPAAPEAEAPRQAALRPLAAANPAARALRLLEALARAEAASCPLALLDGHVEVTLTPCSTATASAP